MTLKLRKLVVCASLVLAGYAALLSPSSLAAADESPDKSAFTRDNSAPVYVKSDQLTLKAKERIFEYHGNVQAIQADLTIWADHLAGTYGEDNEIQTLTATKNVLVEKGENIRATGQKAIFEEETQTIVLTENPELKRQESVLIADKITIFLNEDRSAAEGNVRVKLVSSDEEGAPGAKKPL